MSAATGWTPSLGAAATRRPRTKPGKTTADGLTRGSNSSSCPRGSSGQNGRLQYLLAPLAETGGRGHCQGPLFRVVDAVVLSVDETRATHLVHAVGGGTTLALIATPENRRDLSVSHLAREAVIAAITTDAPTTTAAGPAGAAVALRALLPRSSVLTAGERGLLAELLDRISTG
ncbi:hypothetical protein OG788_02815 [Streptomyces sp. NBC_00647]|uniref:hypothetical protein n=1 Tax=Streptomyces sp. NBC_00647 TaxID=2975796 RepID=UPI0032459A10